MKIATFLLCLVSFFPQTDQKIVLIIKGEEVIVTKSEAQAEYASLVKLKSLTPEQHSRLSALVASLGTLPDPVRCITWEQHLAETRSWHEAPERVYVDCDDLRVVQGKLGERMSRYVF